MGIVEPVKTVKKSSAAGYRALAAIVLILTVGGLFIGLLGNLEPLKFFAATGYYASSAVEVLPGSLMGYIVAFFKNVFVTEGPLEYVKQLIEANSVIFYADLLLVVLLCAAVLVSLITAIVAFVSRKAARICAMTGTIVSTLVYGGMFALCYYYYCLMDADVFVKEMFDLPTAAITAALVLCLAVVALARSKGLGLLNLIQLVLTAAVLFAVTYPGSLLLQYTATPLDFVSTSKDALFVNIASLLLLAALLLNLAISVIRADAKKGYLIDCIRFSVLLLAVLLLLLSFILTSVGGSSWAVFQSDLLPVILLIAAPLASLLLALIVAIAQACKQRKQEAVLESAALTIAAQPPASETQDTAETQPASAAQNAQTEEPVLAEPVQQPEEALPAAKTLSEQSGATEMTENTAAYIHTPIPVAEPAVQQDAPMQNTPMSEFERSMAALARGREPEPAPTPTAYYTPAYPQPAPAPVYDASQYTYDPFINSLTPQEKNEFGDLFIAGKYGDLNYLPAYVIGGDNREFFNKVFIYLGRFRQHISSSLLEKLYAYVSRNQ